MQTLRGGVAVAGSIDDAMRLNLHSRIAQRVLVQVAHAPYRDEHELYALASGVVWEDWFTERQSIKVDITAHASPLKSLNFATLRVKDAVVDRFRERGGERPDVDTRFPDVRIHVHLSATEATLYIDTSGEPLFKRGWREDKGAAPLKETLAAAMLAASGWEAASPLYDPCCGSGTIAIEAAQIACGIAPGALRRFAFEKLAGFDRNRWLAIKREAEERVQMRSGAVFGSDVAHRMVDFAQRNARRAGVEAAVEFRGGDALQRMPPTAEPGVLLLNPPYGERIEVAGFAGRGGQRQVREEASSADGESFFPQLAAHWKKHYPGWTAWLLSPDPKLPGKMRLKESRRIPLWNGPIECRLLRFDMVKGSAR